MKKFLRLTHARVVSQTVFFGLFIFSIWASWTSRIEGYPVSRLLEMDPLVALATLLSTGYVYQFLGWSLLIVFITLLFGRVFCNWICPFGTLHQLVGNLFNTRNAHKRIEQNQYHQKQYLKYGGLVVFLVLALFGRLQIGWLDPLATLYRGFIAFFAPAWDMLVNVLTGAGFDPAWSSQLKFAPDVPSRVLTGSFWVGLFFLLLVF